MKGLRESVFIIGRVLGLILVDKLNTPTLDVLEQYPYLRFDARFPTL